MADPSVNLDTLYAAERISQRPAEQIRTMESTAALVACGGAAVLGAAWLYYCSRRIAKVRQRVVVIGGGFAGIEACTSLQNKCDVTLIDCKDYHEYTPE